MFSPTISTFFIISSLLVLSSLANAQTPPKSKGFVFPIRKDDATNQYYTTIQIGSNATTFNVVLDLGAKFTWFNSLEYFNAADSYRPIRCGTKKCRIADGIGCVFCSLSPPVPGCTNNTCSDYAVNPFSGTQGYNGLGQDVLRVTSTGGVHYRVRNFPFQFSYPVLREALATPTAGLVGLGRTKISLPAQLSSAFGIREKFSLCMPSSGSNGNMIVGDVAYRAPFQAISDSALTTPLVRNPVSTRMNEAIGNFSIEYFIGVKSIRVGGVALALNKTLLSINKKTGEGGTGIRTVRGYTSMHKSIYDALVKQFVKAAVAKKKIKRVAAVAPFAACFDSNTILSTKSGPDVPTVDLILQSEKVYWRFYGSNSMVRVSDGVMCLAFVEVQPNLTGPTTSIVVGGYQMENHLLEFDVSGSELGFSSSLLLSDTTCSQFAAA